MPATIRDIKNRTGLSLATISKYLNGGNVRPENRVLIEQAVKELHYEVNEIARCLVTNKTKTIGVIVYNVASLFNGELLRHIGNALRQYDYGMLICDSSQDEEIEKRNVKFLVNKKVDGIIVVPISLKSDFLKPAVDASIPIVLMDRSFRDASFDCVRIDNYLAAYRAVQELLKANHKKVAVICSNEEEYTGDERFRGYKSALKDAGVALKDEYLKRGRHTLEYGYESMKELMQLEDRPTAIFMGNYEITLGAVMAINEMGIRCPEDVSIMGFDDLILAHLIRPPMTSVVQPMQQIGERAVSMLMNRINGNEDGPSEEVVLSTQIGEGNSISIIK